MIKTQPRASTASRRRRQIKKREWRDEEKRAYGAYWAYSLILILIYLDSVIWYMAQGEYLGIKFTRFIYKKKKRVPCSGGTHGCHNRIGWGDIAYMTEIKGIYCSKNCCAKRVRDNNLRRAMNVMKHKKELEERACTLQHPARTKE